MMFFGRKNRRKFWSRDPEAEKKEWEKLKRETVRKMKKEAKAASLLTDEQKRQVRIMKVMSSILLPACFALTVFLGWIGCLLCILVAGIWFLIFFRKNIRYAFIGPLCGGLTAFYTFVSYGFNFIFK